MSDNNNIKENTPNKKDEDQVPPIEQIASIAYNIAMFETVQKFNVLYMRNEICGKTPDQISQALAETRAFFDSGLIAQLINGFREANGIQKQVGTVDDDHIEYVLKQLQQTGDLKGT